MKKTFPPLFLDVALVVLFVFIGTRNHDTNTGASGVAGTAAPFLLGLLAGWLVTRAWRQPMQVKTGAVIWVITVVVGVLLRRFAWDDGAAGPFVVVAAIFNAFTLVGWRVVRENVVSRTRAASE